MRPALIPLVLLVLHLSGPAAADPAPLPKPAQSVDLERYAGDWYVHGCIPLEIPFFSDANARNYTEHYSLLAPGTIEMTSAFSDGAGEGSQYRSFSFKGDIIENSLNATWKIWFVWPFSANYSIIYLDDSYLTTIVASANRHLAWIMTREPQISDAEYTRLINFLASAGFDAEKFRRIPHDNPQIALLR